MQMKRAPRITELFLSLADQAKYGLLCNKLQSNNAANQAQYCAQQ